MSLVIKLALTPLLAAQAVATRKRMPRLPEAEGPREGAVGDAQAGARALRLLIAGDSSAAGVGVLTQEQALAGQLASRLVPRCAAHVQWRLVARAGVTTEQLIDLLQQQPQPIHADLALIVTGVNDLIDQMPSRRATRARDRLANLLRNGHGVHHVMFCPLPPVHQMPGLPQPLRWLAGTDAQRHNAALARWVRTRGDVSQVPLDVQLNRGVMARDGFHPGEPVYRQVAIAVVEHMARHMAPHMAPPPPGHHPASPLTSTPASS
jgi:lysophospholipase L1-like esterase